MKATPEMIAAAWREFTSHLYGQKLKPGPGFREAIQAALDVMERDGGWLPIETAPKDGTEIDIWTDERVADVIWSQDCKAWVHYSPTVDCSFYTRVKGSPPYYWRPLPAPPMKE